MCRFVIDKNEFFKVFAHRFQDYFSDEAGHIKECVEDGLIQEDNVRLMVTDLGKLFIRNVCMGFDWYLRQKNGHKRFSRTV